MKRITVIGKNGFLGQSLRIHSGWTFLPHDAALNDTAWIDRTDVLINCAFAPALRTDAYDPAMDIDAELAEKIAKHNHIHYITISSRAVYGPSNGTTPWCETDTPAPNTHYARNKLRIEQNVQSILGQRATLLRLATVFGCELGRKSFFGIAMDRLLSHGEIHLDMHQDTRRDFISVDCFARAIGIIAHTPASGVFNLGSGIGTKCGDIAQWLIDGYGRGKITAADDMKDPFTLNMDKTRAQWPDIPETTTQDIQKDALRCGAWLRDHAEI